MVALSIQCNHATLIPKNATGLTTQLQPSTLKAQLDYIYRETSSTTLTQLKIKTNATLLLKIQIIVSLQNIAYEEKQIFITTFNQIERCPTLPWHG